MCEPIKWKEGKVGTYLEILFCLLFLNLLACIFNIINPTELQPLLSFFLKKKSNWVIYSGYYWWWSAWEGSKETLYLWKVCSLLLFALLFINLNLYNSVLTLLTIFSFFECSFFTWFSEVVWSDGRVDEVRTYINEKAIVIFQCFCKICFTSEFCV